tara:strand:- start:615 stop:1649 length:1035 start_codon:yes stop_codon:yes gene_type:complete
MEGEKEGPLPNLSFLPMSDQSKQQQKKRKHRSDAPDPDVVDGAKAVWERMRQLGASNVVDVVQEKSAETVTTEELASAIALLESPVLREAQVRLITERYRAFVESIDSSSNEWRAVDEYVREGESTVNEYLTWRPDKLHNDPTENYEWGHDSTPSDDEEDDPDLRKLWRRPEQQLFYLYGLLNRCPPLDAPVTLLRSVKFVRRLPHSPPDSEPGAGTWRPTVGKAYLNTRFVSTSLAPLNDYLSWRDEPPPLSHFYDPRVGCCMCAITVDAGVKVLPIAIDNDEWGKRGEQEVLLPPGLVYVFQGTKKITVKNEKRSKATGKVRHHEFNIFFYRAMLPEGSSFV